jgi:uncharacterized heparinase superfamily protein
MHNTVEVDGADSSEVWAAFRVARRAKPFDVRWGRDNGTLWLEASHDGYRRLRGKVTHRRRWELQESGLRIVDQLDGPFKQAVARFRFTPACSGLRGEGRQRALTAGSRAVRWSGHGQAAEVLTSGTWHPRFGASEPCRVLEMRFTGAELETVFSWS